MDDDDEEGGLGEDGEEGHGDVSVDQHTPADVEMEAVTNTATVEGVNQAMMGDDVPATTTSETITTEGNGADAGGSLMASVEETKASHPSEAALSASPQRNNLPRPSRSLSQRQQGL